MNITNKKLAFYVALIASVIVTGLLFTEKISIAQAQLGLIAIAGACAPFGIADVFYDYLSIIFRVAETVVSLTPSTDDDKALADLRTVFTENTKTTTTLSTPVFTENPDNVSLAG